MVEVKHTEAKAAAKLELWFFRDMFESDRLALFSLFGFKGEEVGTLREQQKIFRHILAIAAKDAEIECLSAALNGSSDAP